MIVDQEMSWDKAIEQVVASLEGAIPFEEFCQRVLALRPSSIKNPQSSIRQRLRYDWRNRLLYLNHDTLLPTRFAMQGVRFAVPLESHAVKRSLLLTAPTFTGFFTYRTPLETMKLFDANGQSLPMVLKSFKETENTPFGDMEVEHSGFELVEWFKSHQAQAGDYVLITIEDWDRKHFRLEYESAHSREQHRAEIAAKNQELADLIYDALESERYEEVDVSVAVYGAYARMQDPRGYPGDHWLQVIEQDSRMLYDGFTIRYSNWRSLLDMFADTSEESASVEPIAVSPEQARAVYRFEAALKYRKGLWRRIEIQGGQTLADFNHILVDAFEHDWDHMGGFWKRVRRGKSKRYRDIDLGTVDPFGEGEGADTPIAAIELHPGDVLKYVFDFGDWIEHTLTLEEIVEPEEGVKYPRIAAQNKPRYRYCEKCKEEGRKTVATWICIDCSYREQRDVLLCEDCLAEEHEDHYADEILY